MTRFCPVLGNAHPSQEGFCSLCGIALSKKPNVIDLNTTLSPAVISPLLQDRAIYIPAIPTNRAVVGSAVLVANIRVQKGSIPFARQPVLSAQSSKTVTCVSHCTMVSLFIISYHFKSY
jgi:hypothetical protein